MGKDGRSVAVAYPLDKTGWKHPASYQNMGKSSEVESLMRHTFNTKTTLHAGMLKKPLMPYNPNATRSRLPTATVVMPYKNASNVVIGDRASVYKKHFATTNKLNILHPTRNATQNTGIISERTKWIHHLQHS